MPIIAREPKSEYQQAPEGLHTAVCIDVVDLGLVQSEFGTKHKVQIRWAVEEQDDNWRQFYVSRRFTLSLHQKSALRQALEMWRGRKFTAKELEGFDLEKLLGVGGQVQIVHNARPNGQVYADVQAAIPLAKGQPKPGMPADYVRMQDREAQRHVDVEPAIVDDDVDTFDPDVPF